MALVSSFPTQKDAVHRGSTFLIPASNFCIPKVYVVAKLAPGSHERVTQSLRAPLNNFLSTPNGGYCVDILDCGIDAAPKSIGPI
jgi:hypothetical protein